MDEGPSLAPMITTSRNGAAEALYGIASALADETGLDFAIMYAQMALVLRDEFPIARTLLATVFESVQLYENAIEAYQGIPRNSPLWENAEIQTAINLNLLERPDDARERLERLIQTDASAVQPPITLANILRNRSEFGEAATYYTRAVEAMGEVEQRHWTVFYFRGICFERTKMWHSAEVDFMKALELQPDQPLVLNYLGYSWIEQRHNLVEAMEMIRKAVELRPNDGYIVDSLGWAHYQLRQYEDAVRELERAVELRPDDPVINEHLGDAYWRVDRRVEARFQWQHSLDLGPDAEKIEAIERKLEIGLAEEA
jgi:tetratricopeptide (TPR) repeat protein